MTTELLEKVKTNAYQTSTAPCFWRNSNPEHATCEVTHYSTAMILTYGSTKAHRITFTEHSIEAGKVYAPAGPGCGSKQAGKNWVAYGRFVPAVTCGRC